MSLLSIALTACGATASVVTPTTAPAAHLTPRPLSLSNEPARATLLPTIGRLSLVSDRGDERSYLFGSMRVRISGREATLGAEPFASEITAATKTDAGWVFVAADGAVAMSESFTGTLRRLGQAPIFAPQGARTSRGRAVVADGSGRLWSTDGVQDLTPVAALASRHIESAAFSDALHGAAVVRGGELLFTSDGGTVWQPVALPGATATSVACAGDALVLETTAGARRIAADGAVTPNAVGLPEPVRPAAGDAARALDAVLLAYPDLLANLEVVARDDGVSVLIDRDALVVLTARDARVQRRVTGIPLNGCSLASWGPAIAIYCNASSDDSDPRAYRWNDTEAVPLDIPVNALGAVYSDDARHAARTHACHGDPGNAASICVLRDGIRDWRTVTATSPLERLIAMRGTTLLARTTDAHIIVVDAETGATTSPTLLSDRSDLTPVFIGFTRDGGFAGTADDAEHGHYTLLGRTITQLRATPLPRGAITCGFVDLQHGAAAGRTAGQFWRTIDGAANWERVDLGIDGLTREVPLLPRPEAIYGSIVCSGLGCTIGRAASIRGWGPLAAPAHHVLGPIAPPAAAAAAPTSIEPAVPPVVAPAEATAAPRASTPARRRGHHDNGRPAHPAEPAGHTDHSHQRQPAGTTNHSRGGR